MPGDGSFVTDVEISGEDGLGTVWSSGWSNGLYRIYLLIAQFGKNGQTAGHKGCKDSSLASSGWPIF